MQAIALRTAVAAECMYRKPSAEGGVERVGDPSTFGRLIHNGSLVACTLFRICVPPPPPTQRIFSVPLATNNFFHSFSYHSPARPSIRRRAAAQGFPRFAHRIVVASCAYRSNRCTVFFQPVAAM